MSRLPGSHGLQVESENSVRLIEPLQSPQPAEFQNHLGEERATCFWDNNFVPLGQELCPK